MQYRITFDRIGRNYKVPPLTVVTDDVETIPDTIWEAARKHLGSRFYDVTVDLEGGRVSIEHGRFGSGTIEALTT